MMSYKTFLETPNGAWDNMIAFSSKDISEMLHIPISSVRQLLREGQLDTFRIGRHYRVSRQALYRYLEDNLDVVI